MFGFGPFGSMPFASSGGFYHIPAAETDEGKKRLEEYYSALGRFIDMFAQVETAVTFTLWHYAKTPPDIGKIVFASAKIEVSSTFIKQLAAATGTPKELLDDLEYILQQLAIINGNRNHIVHYGASAIAEGQGFVTNAFKAKGEPVTFPISPIALEEMTHDLRKISFHLRYRHYSGAHVRNGPGQEILQEVLRVPWRYKHPPQPKGSAKKAAD